MLYYISKSERWNEWLHKTQFNEIQSFERFHPKLKAAILDLKNTDWIPHEAQKISESILSVLMNFCLKSFILCDKIKEKRSSIKSIVVKNCLFYVLTESAIIFIRIYRKFCSMGSYSGHKANSIALLLSIIDDSRTEAVGFWDLQQCNVFPRFIDYVISCPRRHNFVYRILNALAQMLVTVGNYQCSWWHAEFRRAPKIAPRLQ